MLEHLLRRSAKFAPGAVERLGRALGGLPEHVRLSVVRELVLGLAATEPDGLPGLLQRVVGAALRDAPLETVHAVHLALERVVGEDARSVDYGLTCGRGLAEHLARFGAPVEGARVLELGPGWTLASGLAFVALGAARWTGADVAPLATLRSAPYRRARAQVAAGVLRGDAAAHVASFDAAADLSGDDARFDAARLDYLAPTDATRLPLADGSVDVVVSNASLEHVRDPAGVIRESWRVLAKGGVGLHQVDLRDHRDFGRPRAFLADDDATWSGRYAQDAGNHEHTNRWRRGDLTRAFEAAGFVVQAAEVTSRAPLEAAERQALDARFRDLPAEELETLGVLFFVRKV